MRVILYTKHFNEEIKEKVDVILSPQFYWVKKIDVAKNIFEAKKIAKNIFKLDQNEYIFEVFKIDNKFFAFAIKKDLRLNIDKKYISSIRLAQIELYNYDCIYIDKNHSIKKIDDILFCFPTVEEDCPKIDEILKNIKLSKHKINIYNQLNIDNSILIFSILSLLFFNLFFILGIFSYSKDLSKLNNKFNSLRKYNLPLTTFQLDSIYSSLKETDEKEKKIKRALSVFTKSPVKNYIKLSFNGKYYDVEINTTKNLDTYFSRYFKILSSSYGKIYKVKLAYE